MTEAMYTALLDKAEAKKNKSGEAELPEGRTMTLYVAHEGCSMSVSRVVGLKLDANIIEARNNKGELFVISLEDAFAGSISGGSKSSESRSAGFRTS